MELAKEESNKCRQQGMLSFDELQVAAPEIRTKMVLRNISGGARQWIRQLDRIHHIIPKGYCSWNAFLADWKP